MDLTLEEIMPHLDPEGLLHVKLAGARALLAREQAKTAELQRAVDEATGSD